MNTSLKPTSDCDTNAQHPTVIIDCLNLNVQVTIFSMSQLERILRQLDMCGIREANAIVPAGLPVGPLLRKDFGTHFSLRVTWVVSDSIITACKNMSFSNAGLIILDGNALLDDRIIDMLIKSTESISITAGDEPVPWTVRLLHTDIEAWLDDQNQPAPLIQLPLQKVVNISEMDTYVRFLRKRVPPVFLKSTPEMNVRSVENMLYDRTFKGAMEFIATYGYRVPVRELTRLVARTRISPNQVTGLAVVCSFSAIPCFWLGLLWPGLILAASFIVLDSLDGKLARLTYRLSHVADRVDHLTSLPTRMGWYSGMGWFFSGGDWQNAAGIGGILLTVIPFIDKQILNLCNWRFGRSLLDFTPMDRRVHLFTVRRNDIFLMIIGSILNLSLQTYFAIVGWMVATWLWHSIRILWLFVTVPSGKRMDNALSVNTNQR